MSDTIEINLFSSDQGYVYRVPPATTVRCLNSSDLLSGYTWGALSHCIGSMVDYIPNSIIIIAQSGHRAETWNVGTWLAEVSVKFVKKMVGSEDLAYIQLQDPASGDMWAECPVSVPLHTCVERVIDSSRYFVIRVVDPESGHHAFIGLGFAERDVAADFYASLVDYQQYLERKQRAEEMQAQAHEPATGEATAGHHGNAIKPSDDMALKSGQTMQLKLNANHAASHSGGGFVSRNKHGKLAKTFSLMFDPQGGMEAALAPSSQGNSPKVGESPTAGKSYSTEEEWGAFESPGQSN